MIKIFIIDDHQLFIDGLKMILGLVDGFQVVGEACSGEEGITALENLEVDVLITDYSMKGMNGYDVTKYVKNRFPNINILTLSMHDDIGHINKMTKAGSLGYILKNTGKRELKEAIETVNRGEAYYSVKVKEAILKKYTKDSKPVVVEKKIATGEEVVFTRREEQVLKMMVIGLPTKEIADALSMSYHTVNTHRKNINSKITAASDLTVLQYVKLHNL